MADPVITLLTDFGLRDGYVAAMKGVMLQRCPTVHFVDISHNVAPQAIAEAAFILDSTFDFFPAKTVHTVVVDPGVGTDRAMLAVGVAHQLVLAPDNGVLSLLLNRYPEALIHQLSNTALFAEQVSATFHGRDIFAPVAAFLANGGPLESVGPRVHRHKGLSMQAALVESDHLTGRVIYVDGFGNAVTNIEARALPERVAHVEIAGGRQLNFYHTYSDVPAGEPLALLGSHGRLEIAVNCGHAAAQLGLTPGQSVRIPLGD